MAEDLKTQLFRIGYVLPGEIWHLCDKGCTHNWKGTPKIGER